MGNYTVIVLLGVIIIPQLIITYIIISFMYIFADVNIFILIFCAFCFIFFFSGLSKFIFFKFIFVVLILLFQCGILFHLLLYTLIQYGCGHLQQFHKLYLLR